MKQMRQSSAKHEERGEGGGRMEEGREDIEDRIRGELDEHRVWYVKVWVLWRVTAPTL